MSAQKRITVERNIKQDVDTGKYYVTFYHGKDNAGKAIRKTKTFDHLADARIALKEHELAFEKGDAIPPSRLDLNKAIENHLEVLSLKSEESTLYGYKGIAKHIKTHKLGKRAIQDIKPTDVQAYLAYLQKEKELSSNTALKHYNFLNAVFNLLEQQEQINRNPVKRVVAPKKQAHKPEYLTVEETQELLKKVQGDRMEVPFALGLYTGMRRGELCGLQWEHVDFKANTIRVTNNRINVGAKIVEKKPKSTTSERTIHMVPELRKILLLENEIQENNSELLKTEYKNEGYVICHNDGQAVRPNYLSEMFKRWFGKPENRGLHAITPHELRHSFVALSIAAKVPLYEISKALGHGDIGITSRVYAHMLDGSHKGVTEGMASLLRK